MKQSIQQMLQCIFIMSIILPAMLIAPDSAWALQAHGAREGIYVHQMAHVFFFFSLLYLYRDFRRSTSIGRGWNYLMWFCLFLMAWNIVAFTGHAVAAYLAPEYIAQAASYFHSRLIGPLNGIKAVFYITRFDHLLLVPAFFFLYMGLRNLYISVEHEQEASEEGGKS